MSDIAIKSLVDRFLAWPLPKTVVSDRCASIPDYPYPRSGTTLLTENEARQMIEHLLGDTVIRDLERNLAEERETRIRFGKMLDERAKEVGELQRELGNVRAERNALDQLTDQRFNEIEGLRRRIAELEGAEPEAETEWYVQWEEKSTISSYDKTCTSLAEVNEILSKAEVRSVRIIPRRKTPKTRRVTFWCRFFKNSNGVRGISGWEDRSYWDRREVDAIPVTIDVEE